MGLFDDAVLGVPSISLKGVRRGTKIEGILLPQPDLDKSTGMVELKAYREEPATDDDGNVKTYPRSGDVIMEGRFLLQTRLSAWELTSQKFEERAREDFPDETDDGRRRWFLGSKYAVDAVKEAFRALKARPEIGGLMTIEVVGINTGIISKGPDAGKEYTSPKLKVAWTPATDEGRKVVQAYVDSGKMPEIKAPEQPSQTFPDTLPDESSPAPWGASTGTAVPSAPPF